MNLVIDQGNTSIKYGIFNEDKLINSKKIGSVDPVWINNIILKYPIHQFIFSSVKNEGNDLFKQIKQFIPNGLLVDANTPLPFKNCYKTPQTLGRDRIAAVAGAIDTFPNSPILVIDAGTAITFEFISPKQEYLGGNISPGLSLRFKSLNTYTSQLPLLGQSDIYSLIGNSTNDAIISGVQNSIIFEIDSYINLFNQQFNDIKTIITGGDAEFFAGKLKNPIFVDLNLVLKGLNRILTHNA